MLLGFTFNLLTIINFNEDQFVDHPTTIKILVKFYLQQAAQVMMGKEPIYYEGDGGFIVSFHLEYRKFETKILT